MEKEQKIIHPVDKHVGQRLRQRRWVVGITQQQLAENVGIKFQQIQKYETGANRVSASRLWDISRALDVPISYFFEDMVDDDQAVSEEEANEASVLDKETATLVRYYRQIPEKQRRKLFDLAQTLSDD